MRAVGLPDAGQLLLIVANCWGCCGTFVARIFRRRLQSFNVRFRPKADLRPMNANARFGALGVAVALP